MNIEKIVKNAIEDAIDYGDFNCDSAGRLILSKQELHQFVCDMFSNALELEHSDNIERLEKVKEKFEKMCGKKNDYISGKVQESLLMGVNECIYGLKNKELA